MAGRSWGHALFKLTPEDIADLRRRDAAWVERRGEPAGGRRWRDTECRTGKCTNDATHWTTWRYITGRAGRVSSQRRLVCDEHGAKFRAKHDLPAPEPRPLRDRALDQAVRELTGAEDGTP